MENLPPYVALLFGLSVLLTAFLFLKAARYSRPVLAFLLGWAGLQSALALAGFYRDPGTMSTRFPLSFLPLLLLIAALFATRRGRAFIDGLRLQDLTLLHIVRVPVEMVLFWLYVHGGIPAAMTFEGRNFDLFSGLSAPLVWYFGFVRPRLGTAVLIGWNLLCLALLLNVVGTAILALPARYAQFGFEQANTALGRFPFILLPALVVPLVLLSTLAALRQLLRRPRS